MGNCGGRMIPIKLIGSQGELSLISAPVTAAELMLDNPGYAVAQLDSILFMRRVTAAKADETLTPGKAYLLVPVDRVGCRVSDLHMAAVLEAARRCRISSSKVFAEAPSDGVDYAVVAGGVDMKNSAAARGGGNVKGGCRRSRSGLPWSPALEPILETC
ncbi:hypothetical protein V2J09_022151 [Rumex salicifolius]